MVWEFHIHVYRGERVERIGWEQISQKETSRRCWFLVVYYTVENMTHEPVSGFSGEFERFRVKDKSGRTYNANRTYISYTGEKSISELPPGLPMKTAAVFEMPLSSFEGDTSFTVVIPENGDFKGETRELTLTNVAKAAPGTNQTKGRTKSKS